MLREAHRQHVIYREGQAISVDLTSPLEPPEDWREDGYLWIDTSDLGNIVIKVWDATTREWKIVG